MAETRIPIEIPNHATSLLVGRGLVDDLAGALARSGISVAGRAVVVACDANVGLHAQAVERSLSTAGARTVTVSLAAREAAKSMRAVEDVWRAALSIRADRSALVVAVGGGLVGDLAGFAAATYLRGIDLVQVPTTLLAMVDASIGGKTGINLALPDGSLGKNLAGAFWQPRLTVADPAVLATLPRRELRAGLAESVKHAVIDGEGHFAALERDATALAEGEPAALDRLVPMSAAVKARIVARDPFERGERALLNLGHTFGHAIETDPSTELLHGEAVAIGCVAAARCAVGLGMLPSADADRVERLLRACGLPVALPTSVSAASVRQRMGYDKKVAGGALRLVLPKAIGSVEVVSAPPEAAVADALASIGAR
ncbi:MAG: 3-dehydroquinate synthase [Planctomycetota bacterium]